jgi:uncharacterized membrane protein YgcG
MGWCSGFKRHVCGRAFLLGLLALILSSPLPGWARSWRIADFHDRISISSDGSALVEEELALVFVGQFQGINRIIPVKYPGVYGSNYTLFLDVREVTDDRGRPLKYEIKRSDAYETVTVYIPGAVDTTRVVRLLYTIPNAVRYFPDHDEFYWNVTGNDWPVPIAHASATVIFPPAAAGSLQVQAFTGVYGMRGLEARSSVDASVVSVETSNPLPMRGGLTLDIYAPKGILQEPSILARAGWFLRSNSILLLPVFAFAVMFSLWWYKGKDPDPGMSVAPMYEPPADMSPAEVGTLMVDSVDPRDISATVVDLAVRGVLKIEESDERHLLWSNKDYIFHLLKGRDDWVSLRPHERVMLEHIFGNAQTVRMSSLKNQFYPAVPVIKQDVMAALRRKGMYSVDPASAGTYVVAAAALIAAPFVLLQVFGVVNFFQSVTMALIGIGLTAVIVVLFGKQMTAKSLLGVRTRVKILGFEEFIKRVDADRLKQMPADTFEKYLPYAMALGLEHRWAQAFKDILKEPPRWYAGPGYPGMYWNPVLFSSSMHTMSADLHTVMTMAPRSSASGSGWGGGGGGGGGFSGGGFGGGGGSAF